MSQVESRASQTTVVQDRAEAPNRGTAEQLVSTGIPPLDARIGGLRPGASYLLTGAPGPVKLVAALHVLQVGLERDERVGVVTGAPVEDFLRIARSWGVDLTAAWRSGRVQIAGFRQDFELRATRSVSPREVMDELDLVLGRDLSRLIVDPGANFLAGGSRSFLGSEYLQWARSHPATVCTTLSLDGDGATLPAGADWLLHATDGRLVVERRSGELYQITLVPSVPTGLERVEPVSLMLDPGAGLKRPDHFPSRRGDDRGAVDPDRLLLVDLGEEDGGELRRWAEAGFRTTAVREVLDGMEAIQQDDSFGVILVRSPRRRIRDARQALRTLRPLTRGALVFASDDDVRSADRIHMLEAGADECLTGGIDLPELDLRIRQAVLSGSRALPPRRGEGVDPDGDLRGRVDGTAFRAEVLRRASQPVENVFSIVQIRTAPVEASEMEAILMEEIRDEDGDLMTGLSAGHLVLLQGARTHQAEPFVARVTSQLRGREGALTVEVLSHPADDTAIRALMEDVGDQSG